MKILIAEKNDVIRNSIFHVLSKEGYQLTLAANGKIAYDFILESVFDIVVTNITLPYYSGFELITLIKSKEELKTTKIIVLSDNFTADNMHRLYKMGIDDMIAKPFTPMEIICRLGKLREHINKK